MITLTEMMIAGMMGGIIGSIIGEILHRSKTKKLKTQLLNQIAMLEELKARRGKFLAEQKIMIEKLKKTQSER